jgi:heterodisulfide reductase subunit C
MVNGTSAVILAKCYGCGLCTSSCSGEARTMIKRKDYRNQYYPIELVGEGSIPTIAS